MKQFKLGDRVQIISEEEVKKHPVDADGDYNFGSNYFMSDMLKFCGKTAKVIEIPEYGVYSIDLDEGFWLWSRDMLEKPSMLSPFQDYILRLLHASNLPLHVRLITIAKVLKHRMLDRMGYNHWNQEPMGVGYWWEWRNKERTMLSQVDAAGF